MFSHVDLLFGSGTCPGLASFISFFTSFWGLFPLPTPGCFLALFVCVSGLLGRALPLALFFLLLLLLREPLRYLVLL